jgi:hypothetical protein
MSPGTRSNLQPADIIQDALIGAIKERQAAHRANPSAYTPGSPDRWLTPSLRVGKSKVLVYYGNPRRPAVCSPGALYQVRKAKGDPGVACYDANGNLIGICDPDNLQPLQEGKAITAPDDAPAPSPQQAANDQIRQQGVDNAQVNQPVAKGLVG